VPELAEAAQRGERSARVEEREGPERFAFPERHPDHAGGTPGRAFVTVMEGCDLFCAFCIVPLTRGRELSRPATAILDEAEALARRGVREITLLGQTVNAYGRHDLRRGRAVAAGTLPFAELLERLAAIPGLARLRYTSPHPIFFDDALAAAHARLAPLCPHVHLPLQSGSDAILERMRRRYTRDGYRRVVDRLRAARPDLALTTDLIVGFPGETDQDFRDTLALVRESPRRRLPFRSRPGPAPRAAGCGPVPAEVRRPARGAPGASSGAHPRGPPRARRERTESSSRGRAAGGSQLSAATPTTGRELRGHPAQVRPVLVEGAARAAPLLLGRWRAAALPRARGRCGAAPRADELIQIQASRP
jgi:MiaB/RimO family radical SAM methylthiotransferase